MTEPWHVAFEFLHHNLPTWPAESIRALIHHPRRCAPNFAAYVEATGLPTSLAHELWVANQAWKDAA